MWHENITFKVIKDMSFKQAGTVSELVYALCAAKCEIYLLYLMDKMVIFNNNRLILKSFKNLRGFRLNPL
jgi:hypothetical protein